MVYMALLSCDANRCLFYTSVLLEIVGSHADRFLPELVSAIDPKDAEPVTIESLGEAVFPKAALTQVPVAKEAFFRNKFSFLDLAGGIPPTNTSKVAFGPRSSSQACSEPSFDDSVHHAFLKPNRTGLPCDNVAEAAEIAAR
jgi:hypothetical protein